MTRAPAAAILFAALLATGADWLDVNADVVVDRVAVPSADRPQAEVRIVRRNGRPVVQTLIDTRVIKRVIGAIAGKERRGWPEGVPGHEDSRRYLAALEAFQRAALARREGAGPGAERRVQASIEFVDQPGHPFVAIGAAVIEGSGRQMRLVSRSAPTVLPLSPEYVLRNMRLIVADSFEVTNEEAASRLARVVAP